MLPVMLLPLPPVPAPALLLALENALADTMVTAAGLLALGKLSLLPPLLAAAAAAAVC
jgi:hypothetical protein